MAEIVSNISIVPSRKILLDEVDGNTTYFGVAKLGGDTSGSFWQIRKIVKSGTLTSILWADGDNLYNNVWDDRATLSYS